MTPEDRRLSLLKPRTPFETEFHRILNEFDKASEPDAITKAAVDRMNERRITVNTPKERLFIVTSKAGGVIFDKNNAFHETEQYKFSYEKLIEFSQKNDMSRYEVFELVPRTVNTTVTIA